MNIKKGTILQAKEDIYMDDDVHDQCLTKGKLYTVLRDSDYDFSDQECFPISSDTYDFRLWGVRNASLYFRQIINVSDNIKIL